MSKRNCIVGSAFALIVFATAGSALAGSGSYSTTRNASTHEVTIENAGNSEVELHFKGADRIHVTLSGALEIVNSDGHVWYYRPDIHQTIGAKSKFVDAQVSYISKDRVTLRLGKVDPTATVIVNPSGRPGSVL